MFQICVWHSKSKRKREKELNATLVQSSSPSFIHNDGLCVGFLPLFCQMHLCVWCVDFCLCRWFLFAFDTTRFSKGAKERSATNLYKMWSNLLRIKPHISIESIGIGLELNIFTFIAAVNSMCRTKHQIPKWTRIDRNERKKFTNKLKTVFVLFMVQMRQFLVLFTHPNISSPTKQEQERKNQTSTEHRRVSNAVVHVRWKPQAH